MPARSTIAYQPALDGVRALAVIAVLLFHAEVPGFDGGYLGVSVFFTLSGYLITTLLLSEHDRTGRIDLPRFYGRRIRRLLPASAACLAGVAVLAAVTDVFDGVADLRRQIVGSVLQVANWVFLAGEGSYQDLFQETGGARSPLEHFWSLAIEEQFYWVWPPVMLLVLRSAPTRRSRLVVVGAVTSVFVVAAPVVAAVWGPDAAYWATPARIAEILIGGLLAVLLHQRTADARLAPLGVVALAALAACVVLFPPSSGPAYEGWLPAVAVVSAALITGVQADGPVRRVLSVPPLVWLGTISYGVYLYHWPVYVVADADRMGFDGPPLVLAQLAITLAISVISFYALERPIRHATSRPEPLTFAGGAMATASVALVAVAIVPAGGDYWEVDAETADAAAIETSDEPLEALVASATPTTTAVPVTSPPTSTSVPSSPSTAPGPDADPDGAVTTTPTTSTTSTTTSTTSTTTTEPPLPDLSRPVRIVVAGDSTADATGAGLVRWAAAHPELAQVEVAAMPGCGFLRDGERKAGEWAPIPPECDDWLDRMLPRRVAELQPDVVVLMTTSWDLLDRRWDGSTVLTPLDDEYGRRIETDYAAITDGMLTAGAGAVAWIRPPIPNVWWMNQGTGQEDPARHAVANSVYERLADLRGGEVGMIPLDTWLIEVGLDDDQTVRPDGVHWDPDAASRIAEDYLGERIVRVALS